jgi:hypothetical protein
MYAGGGGTRGGGGWVIGSIGVMGRPETGEDLV